MSQTSVYDFDSAQTDVLNFKRLKLGKGNPSSKFPDEIQMIKYLASGVLNVNDVSPDPATVLAVLMQGGKRVLQTTLTITSTGIQTNTAGSAANTIGQEALCGVTLEEDSRGIQDLLGYCIKEESDKTGFENSDYAWWIGCTSLGGFSSIKLHAVPGRRV